MRFSCYQQHPLLTDEQSRERRKARFLADLKAEVRQAANAKGFSLSGLARLIGRHRSLVSRALDPSTNVEAFTLFDLAEALGMEWVVSLRQRDMDLGEVLDIGVRSQQRYKVSHSPVISVGQHKNRNSDWTSGNVRQIRNTFTKENV